MLHFQGSLLASRSAKIFGTKAWRGDLEWSPHAHRASCGNSAQDIKYVLSEPSTEISTRATKSPSHHISFSAMDLGYNEIVGSSNIFC